MPRCQTLIAVNEDLSTSFDQLCNDWHHYVVTAITETLVDYIMYDNSADTSGYIYIYTP